MIYISKLIYIYNIKLIFICFLKKKYYLDIKSEL